MGDLDKIQAWEFRSHHERAWPLDYWLNAALPVTATLWSSFALAALSTPDKPAEGEESGNFTQVLNAVQSYLANEPAWTVVILTAAILGWGLIVFAPWLPAFWRSRVVKWRRAGAARPWFIAGLVVLAVLSTALAMSSLRIIPPWWGWWLTLVPFLAWGWWSMRAFRVSEGPVLVRMVLWRVAAIVFLVWGMVLLCSQSGPEKTNPKVALAGSLDFSQFLLPFAQTTVPEASDVPASPETRAVDREMRKVNFYQPPPASPTASPAASPSPSPSPPPQLSRQQKFFLLELLELLGQGIFGGSSGGGGGGSGLTINVDKAVARLNSLDPSKRATGLRMLQSLAEANPGNQQLTRNVNDIRTRLEGPNTASPAGVPPPPATTSTATPTPAASATPSAAPSAHP